MELCRLNRLGWFPRPIFAFTQVTTKRDAFDVALIVAGVLLLVSSPKFVMAGHSRPKDGVASLAYVPAIHALLVIQKGVACPAQGRA